MSPIKVRISFGAFLLLCAFLLLSTLEVFFASMLAIAVHEAGHYAALCSMGNGVKRMSVGGMGMTMHPKKPLSYGRELLALLAGPGANVLLFFLLGALGTAWPCAYILSGAQLLLGVFNLLPVCGLDGSSILWILCALVWEPDTADRITERVSLLFSTALVLLAGILVCRFQSGLLLLWTAMGLFLHGLRQNGLVKRQGKR